VVWTGREKKDISRGGNPGRTGRKAPRVFLLLKEEGGTFIPEDRRNWRGYFTTWSNDTPVKG